MAVTNKGLHELFDGCGTILSAKVASDSSGNSKGYGFVQFDTDEAAKKAIDTVNGKMVHEKPVFVGPQDGEMGQDGELLGEVSQVDRRRRHGAGGVQDDDAQHHAARRGLRPVPLRRN